MRHRYLLADLKRAAEAVGRPEWGLSGPHDAGNYNSKPWETGFFVSQGGSWDAEYGRFFLDWYSSNLLRHAEKLLTVSYQVRANLRRIFSSFKREHCRPLRFLFVCLCIKRVKTPTTATMNRSCEKANPHPHLL